MQLEAKYSFTKSAGFLKTAYWGKTDFLKRETTILSLGIVNHWLFTKKKYAEGTEALK